MAGIPAAGSKGVNTSANVSSSKVLKVGSPESSMSDSLRSEVVHTCGRRLTWTSYSRR